MKLSFFSDIHSYQDIWFSNFQKTPAFKEMLESDVIVFCGDMTSLGKKDEVRNFFEFYNSLPTNAKRICIAGNHDFYLDIDYHKKDIKNYNYSSSLRCREELLDFLNAYQNVIYLHNEEVILDGVKFYGTPDTPFFKNWAFNKNSQEIKRSFENIPNDVDVLITHTPPLNVLDSVYKWGKFNGNVGCPLLKEAIETRNIKVNCFGHIHESYGSYEDDGIIYINSAVLDLDYNPIRNPINIII